MLRLPLVFLLIFSLPVSTFAAMCANGISPDPSQSRVGRVTCNNCSSVTHFARYGGAVLQNNHASSRARYNRVVVSNGRGGSVAVRINQLSSGTGISFSFSLFSFEIRQGNRAEVGVTATPLTGGVSGAPWNRQPTNKGQLSQVCDAIDRERAARQEANTRSAGAGASGNRFAYLASFSNTHRYFTDNGTKIPDYSGWESVSSGYPLTKTSGRINGQKKGRRKTN